MFMDVYRVNFLGHSGLEQVVICAVRRERDPLPQRLMWPGLVFQRCCRQDATLRPTKTTIRMAPLQPSPYQR